MDEKDKQKKYTWVQIDEMSEFQRINFKKHKRLPKEKEKLATCQGIKIKLLSDFPLITVDFTRQGGKAFKVLMKTDFGSWILHPAK